MRNVLVIGASGDVGRGITSVLLEAGWNVIASARTPSRLEELRATFASDRLTLVQGDISTEQGTRRLWQDASAIDGSINAVVVAVSAPASECPLFSWSEVALLQLMRDNVITHFNAAKCLIPELVSGGIFIGIGGGMADFIAPNSAHISMCQASLRMMYQSLDMECKDKNLIIKELMIMSMVNGLSRKHVAEPSWITDLEIGRHVLEVLQSPQNFPDTILKLKPSKKVKNIA
ncbi:MAG: SDR family NAD(P)-dependent oxidoreductase [Pseudomonadota bacterium]